MVLQILLVIQCLAVILLLVRLHISENEKSQVTSELQDMKKSELHLHCLLKMRENEKSQLVSQLQDLMESNDTVEETIETLKHELQNERALVVRLSRSVLQTLDRNSWLTARNAQLETEVVGHNQNTTAQSSRNTQFSYYNRHQNDKAKLDLMINALCSHSKVRMISYIKEIDGGISEKISEHQIETRIDVEVLILNHFYEAFVTVTTSEMKQAQQIVEPIVGELFKFMKSNQKSHQPKFVGDGPLKSGSIEEQLKVLQADEFDFMFPIELPDGISPQFQMCHLQSNCPKDQYGFGKIRVQQNVFNESTKMFMEKFVMLQYLQADRIKNWFKGAVQKGLNHINAHMTEICEKAGQKCLKIKQVKLSDMSAGICLVIELREESIQVDVIPAVKVDNSNMYLITKSLKAHLPLLWRLSYSLYEMKLIGLLGEFLGSTQHTKCLKILKALRDLDIDMNSSSQLSSVLTSYHLKTMLLHIMLNDLKKKCSDSKWKSRALVYEMRNLLEVAETTTDNKELENVFFSPLMREISFRGRSLQEHLNIPDWAIAKDHSQALNLFSEHYIDHNSLNQVSARMEKIQEQWLNVIHQHVYLLVMEIVY
ncbi:inositol 1,4,5-trisphosphate receptor-interacting protein-like [Polypterus senegalus]|uniref:inositol 1,4,5-trisphosphate receptor-interacting protein-like n=1 Tax=Polypterus senegalus TaxID=55291 RepID=UPI001962D9BC|nr:inositol 1,4,5-trisphosphate receptor-interacting protein-like [Polypterus senegalus]XP_039595992.1 inositol 1,4,5-trisphosphate receptor-interacting protein-like [Polypterus senegalus]